MSSLQQKVGALTQLKQIELLIGQIGCTIVSKLEEKIQNLKINTDQFYTEKQQIMKQQLSKFSYGIKTVKQMKMFSEYLRQDQNLQNQKNQKKRKRILIGQSYYQQNYGMVKAKQSECQTRDNHDIVIEETQKQNIKYLDQQSVSSQPEIKTKREITRGRKGKPSQKSTINEKINKKKKQFPETNISNNHKKLEEKSLQKSFMVKILHHTEKVTEQQAHQNLQKLRANLNTCNIILFQNMLSVNKKKILYRNYSRKYFCKLCFLSFFRDYSQKFIEHMKECHSIALNKNNFSKYLYTSQQIFNEQKQAIQKGQIILRKCNCSKQIFKTDELYVQHMNTFHQGNPPFYSTHIINNDGSLTQNPDFNQYIALEQQLYLQIYFCAQCPQTSITSIKSMVKHFQVNHKGQSTFHPASSHFYKNDIQDSHLLTHDEHIKIQKNRANNK